MANTGSGQLDDQVAAEIVADNVIATAYAARVADVFVPKDTISGSLVKSYTRYGKLTAAAMTEGVDGTPTAASDSQVSATVAEIGIGVTLTDLVKVGASVTNLAGRISSLLGQAYVDKVELLELALASSLTNSVGVTTTPLQEDTWFTASYKVEAADGIGLNLVRVLYPKQWNDMLLSIGGQSNSQGVVWSRTDFLDGINPATIRGYKTTINGEPVYVSTNVPSANSSADSLGMVFAVGEDCPFIRVVGVLDGTPWDGRLEFQRDASLRGTESWMTGATGVACVAADRGCGILSRR